MRLIDADTIFGGKLFLIREECYDAVHAVIERINNAPTVDAEPVRSGHWKQQTDKNWSGGGAVVCSACGYGFSYGGYQCAEETFLYCPHCGARMENGGNG